MFANFISIPREFILQFLPGRRQLPFSRRGDERFRGKDFLSSPFSFPSSFSSTTTTTTTRRIPSKERARFKTRIEADVFLTSSSSSRKRHRKEGEEKWEDRKRSGNNRKWERSWFLKSALDLCENRGKSEFSQNKMLTKFVYNNLQYAITCSAQAILRIVDRAARVSTYFQGVLPNNC